MTEHINNEIYNELGIQWYEANDNPVALLRREARTKNPWVLSKIKGHFTDLSSIRLLDVGCGAGFLSNELSTHSIRVTGLDASSSSLEIAKANDTTGNVNYIHGDALGLPFESNSFDVVTSMDFLEHVEDPNLAIAESARVLKPGGLFIFHTFNRNLLCYVIVIKGMEWFVRNTPKNLHLYRLFIKPKELKQYCRNSNLIPGAIQGIRPKFDRGLLHLIKTGSVSEKLSFKVSNSDRIGYVGTAIKSV